MERRQGRIGAAALVEFCAVLIGLAFEYCARVLGTLRFPLLRFAPFEEGGGRQVAEQAHIVKLEPGFVPPVAQLPIRDAGVRLTDPAAQLLDLGHLLAHRDGLESLLGVLVAGVPMERLDLALGESDQRIAVAERVVDERERVFLRQGGQPERYLGQIDRHRVAVDAVETALGDEPAGKDHLVLAGRHVGRGLVDAPRLDQRVAELTAGFDQEGPRAHRRIADLQVEDRLRQRRFAAGAAQAGENRLQRGAHDRLGQFARRVVRPGPAARLARLQHHRARRHEVGRGGRVDHRL